MEQWKRAFGFPDYEVSDQGHCRRIGTTRRLIGGKLRGYRRWCLQKAGKQHNASSHRIVWQSFNRPLVGKEEINHINGVRDDNRIINLEPCTRSQNVLHAYRILGASKPNNPSPGIKNGRAKLTESEVCAIASLIPFHSQQEIADAFGIAQTGVSLIKLGKGWGHLFS